MENKPLFNWDTATQSLEVVTKPSIETINKHKDKGTLVQAVIYVGITAVVGTILLLIAFATTGIFSLPGSFVGNIIVNSLIQGVLFDVLAFVAYAGLTYYVAKQQGGESNSTHLGYSLALIYAPFSLLMSVIIFIALILSITFLSSSIFTILEAAALAFYGQIALKTLTNMTDQNKLWISSGAGALGFIIIKLVLTNRLIF